MKYSYGFAKASLEKKFEAELLKISDRHLREQIMKDVESLSENPRPFGTKAFKQLKPPLFCYQFAARYRIRIGNYRVLYDVDDDKKVVWLIALRRRSEKTYRR